MYKFIEPLILYAVLFLRFSAVVVPEGPLDFSATDEVARIVLYNVPSFALVWYLLLKAKSLKEWGIELPGKKDLAPFALAFPALVLIGLTISKVSLSLEEIPASPRFLPPQGIVPWGILVISSFSTAYLEESFFRFYLLSKREELGLGPHRAILVSALLFSLSHAYEGPWGFLNAALSGIMLAFIFYRFRSLHGIAFAHALYNILVYILNGHE
ncbi:MAG: CPBP family intramembrane metalloprotease [Treponema sp.]|jgi:membrane protease YdiL (CAAX protease family)|nr:CPBP family intramembrane metalloprotease [Treponema sp.]